MGNFIEFRTDLIVDLEMSPRHWVQRARLRRGSRAFVYIVPCVLETAGGPVEAADLHFDDDSVARGVPYEQFSFVD